MSERSEAEARALSNLASFILPGRDLPEVVFEGNWRILEAFEPDMLLSQCAKPAFLELLKVEPSSLVCVVNLDQKQGGQPEAVSTAFLDADMDDHWFIRQDPEDGRPWNWTTKRENFAVTSDVGQWCAFLSFKADIGVFALRKREMGPRYRVAMKLIGACPPEVLACHYHVSDLFRQVGGGEELPAWWQTFLSNYGLRTRKPGGGRRRIRI